MAQPVARAKVDEEHMGQGLGGMLIDAAEQHSERCLAAAGLGLHPSVGCRLGGKEEKQQNETMAVQKLI